MNAKTRRGLVAAALLAVATTAWAQEVRLLENADVRSQASPAAPIVASWRAGHRVQLLELRGGWAQVRDGNTSAWLRASTLETSPAGYASAAALESGRRAPGNQVVSLGVRTYPAPRMNRHALIVGVSAYHDDPARKVEALPGVRHDMLNALVVARYLQVPIENTTLLKDEAATRDGVATAIAQLSARMNPGDRVFIYWAGHGSRYLDAPEGACVESLVPFDLKDVSNKDFASWVKPIGDKADKMLVMFDACHSAGVADVSRSLGTLRPRAAPSADACRTPANVRSRSFSSAVRDAGLSAVDVVHVASARSDEVSFEDSLTGGLATTAMRDCLGGEAVDRDGSGAVTMAEVAACVQAKVDAKMAPFPRLSASHLTLSGNAAFVPALFAAPAPAPTPAPPTAAPVRAADIDDVVKEIYQQRDAKWTVRAVSGSNRVRIGDLMPAWSITSDRDGFVYVVMVGSDRQSLYLLFPNDLDRSNRITAQTAMTIPRQQWDLRAGGPAGDDEILVIVTDGPRDLSALAGTRTVNFTKPLTDAAGRAQLQQVFGTNSRAGTACTSRIGCSDAFGAAVLTVREHD